MGAAVGVEETEAVHVTLHPLLELLWVSMVETRENPTRVGVFTEAIKGMSSWNTHRLNMILRQKSLVHRPFTIADSKGRNTDRVLRRFTGEPDVSSDSEFEGNGLMKPMIVLLRVLSLLMLTLSFFFTKHLLTCRPLLVIPFCK